MSEPTVDVVAVLKKHRADCGIPGCDWCHELDGVIAAMAELIEADREYDLAVAAVRSCTNRPTHFMAPLIDYIDSSRNRLVAAKARRAAALARVSLP